MTTSTTTSPKPEPGIGSNGQRPPTGYPIDVDLAVQRIRLRLGLRLAWLGELRGRYREAEIVAGDLDSLGEELAWHHHGAPPELLDAVDRLESSLAEADGGRLGDLVRLFDLTPAEFDLVQVGLAAALDQGLGRLFAAVQRSEELAFPTEASAGRVCGWESPLLIGTGSPLRTWRLTILEPVGPGRPPALSLDRTITSWLLGQSELDPILGRSGRFLEPPPTPLSDWPVEPLARRLASTGDPVTPTRVVVRGPTGAGRRSFAASVCHRIGLAALVIDTGAIPGDDWSTAVAMSNRQGFLDRAGLIWVGPGSARVAGTAVDTKFPVQFVCLDPGEPIDPDPAMVDVAVELGQPGLVDRNRLWRELVPDSRSWPEKARADVVERGNVTVGDIAAVAASRPQTPAEAAHGLRLRSQSRVGPLLTRLTLPYQRSDLVLTPRSDEALDLVLDECRQRRRFWSEPGRGRLFGHDGLVVLLAGPPGVGKTMAAQVIAADLELDLLRVNLAQTVSKYIGETAKNLSLILDQAAQVGAILLVDEADSLFGRRTELRDAHDRWANADTNHLLQAIENYPGIAVLASNKKEHLDEAFLRRLRHVIDFPAPDPELRRRLWEILLVDVDPSIELETMGDLLNRLSERVELTGAEIKHAVLNAAFEANRNHQPLDPAVVMTGLDRELAKQGRALSAVERRRLHDD